MSHAPATRHVVGIMTGTSLDALDAALVRVDGQGRSLRAVLVHHIERPLGLWQPRLIDLANQQPFTAAEIAEMSHAFGELHRDAILALLKPDWPTPDLIAIHGQTVTHDPPCSWQLINPFPVAAAFGCPIVFDLRQADLAAGGQGAPITPIADAILFARDKHRRAAIVNLGGFCNVTLLLGDGASDAFRDVRGFDLCACNHLLNAAAQSALSQPFDRNGDHAAQGTPELRLQADLRGVLEQQAAANRSLGTGDEAVEWIIEHAGRLAPNDLLATVVHAVAQTIAEQLQPHDPETIILAGGGARNRTLHMAIAARVAAPVHISDEFGVPAEAREAMAMAVLGALAQDKIPITLPGTTGCRTSVPIAGAWVHGFGSFGNSSRADD